MFYKRLKLSVTWGPITSSSSYISLFLFKLHLQQCIIYVLKFLSLCCTARYFTTKSHNTEKKRVTSHLTLIQPNPPLHPSPPSKAACSKGSIPMTVPTQNTLTLPPLKDGEYNSRTASGRIQEISEKNPWREWDPD